MIARIPSLSNLGKPGVYGLFIIAFLLTSILATGQQYMFQINDFKAFDKTVNLLGAATIGNNRLRLTSDHPDQTGACWYSDKKIDFSKGFETEFVFLISSDKVGKKFGDGFAFVIQNQSPTITGGTGDDIGYKKIPYAVALEFDTKDNDEGSKNHINLSFYIPETKTYRKYATVHDIDEITDGKPHFTRIIYHDGLLQVYLDSYLLPVLSVKLNIGEKILSPEQSGWLGFTSATSNQTAFHDLISWSVKEYEEQPEDIVTDSIVVLEKGSLEVKNRKLTISVWDHNTIDGDIISLKLGPEWILTEYTLTGKKYTFETTLLGFSQELILFAHNIGMVPPNTVTVSVFDGLSTQRIILESNMETSESIRIAYTGDEE